MLDTLSDREDVGVGCHQMIVDMNAAADGQPGIARQPDVGPDADRHHHQRCRNLAAVLQPDTLDLALPVYFGGIGAGQDRLPARLQRLLEQPAGGLVELPFHQRRHQVEHRHLHAAQREPMRRLKPEQAAADYHSIAALLSGAQHFADVIHVTERHHALQIMARAWDDERVGPGSEQQLVVVLCPSRPRRDRLRAAINRHHRIAGHQVDRVVRIPGVIVDDDVVEPLVTGEQRRQHDAVVIDPRLGAEDRDAIGIGVARQDFLDGAAAGHAVADHHEMRFFEGHIIHSTESHSLRVSTAKRSAR